MAKDKVARLLAIRSRTLVDASGAIAASEEAEGFAQDAADALAAAEAAAAAAAASAAQLAFLEGDPVLQVRATGGLSGTGEGAPVVLDISRESIRIRDANMAVDDLVTAASKAELLGNISNTGSPWALVIRSTGGISGTGEGAPIQAAIAKGVVIGTDYIGLPDRIDALEAQPASVPVGEPWPEAKIDFLREPTERLGLPQHGQSNAIGPDAVLLSTTAYTGLRMLGSIRRIDLPESGLGWTAGDLTSWGGLDLAASEIVAGAWGETGAVVRGNSLIDHLSRYLGANVSEFGQTFALGATGTGGRTADEVINDTYYDYLTDFMTYADARASDDTLTFRVPSLLYDQGEEDMTDATAKAAYKATVAALPGIVQASQLAISGIDKVVPVGIFQTAKHATYTAGAAELAAWNIAMAQRELAETHSGFFLAACGYAWSYLDNSHLYALGQAIKYATAGRAQAQLHGLGIRPPHLRVIRATWTATGIRLKYFVPVGKLTVDTSTISNPLGFWLGGTILDESDAVVPITGGGLVDGTTDEIEWTTGGTPISGWQFYLGRAGLPNGVFGGAGVGPLAGGRTCIRDQAGDSDTVEIGGESYPLHNWSPFYEFTMA